MAQASSASSRPELRRRFHELFSFYIPEAHRSFYSPGDLELFLDTRFEFFAGRKTAKSAQPKLAVYNPSADFFWLVNSTIIELTLPDSRFIVDTLIDYCGSKGFRINLVLHPVFATRRDAQGELVDLAHPDADQVEGDSGWSFESCVYLEISRLDKAGLRKTENELRANISELRSVVADFPRMARALETAGPDLQEQTRWLLQNFILLGLSERDAAGAPDAKAARPADSAIQDLLDPKKAQHLGILRDSDTRSSLTEEVSALAKNRRDKSALRFRETRVYSNVNRRKPYYLVSLRGKARHILVAGHFASGAELQLRHAIPFVAPRLKSIADGLHAGPTSYTNKKIAQIAQMMPLGLLLTRTQFFKGWLELVLSSEYTDELDYQFVEDPDYESVWVAAMVPGRDADQIPGPHLEKILAEHKVEIRHDVRRPLNRNQFVLLGMHPADGDSGGLLRLLETEGPRIFSSWSVKFRRLIGNKYVGDRNISATLDRFFRGIAPDYELHQSPEEALYDLDTLEQMGAAASDGSQDAAGYRVHFYSGDDFDIVKLYTLQRARFSDLVPTLSNFGFEIFEEFTLPYRRAKDDTRFTYAFRVAPHPELARGDRDRIATAIEAAFNRESVAEPLDALTVTAGLSARETNLLKALLGYFFQIERSFSRQSLQATLLKYPDFARSLVQLFAARLSLDEAAVDEKHARRSIENALKNVESIVDETLLHNLVTIVDAIVRTTFYLEAPEIAFKIDTHQIDFVPAPVPHFEIYVYGYDIEGTHLRGGAVARGGLRWSDRTDDYRTEILGLMKAQMVKNTVIVPVGSKGGFIIKNRSFADRKEFLAAGVDTYRRYIAALLDLTDNLTPAGKTIPARGIHRRDGDDPYLVVAADKGTATFSDIANEISVSKKFWLTDAFASGGANGYDHKKQGITAKGAWEAVRRHFYELGLDPERDPIRAVGIGDMGGDVFGNGMLLSRSLNLIAAFNHLYIFIDPHPKTEAAFAERERLFQLGGAGNWDAYDAKLISKGGGVFERAARKVSLSPEARTALGIKESSLSGEKLIQAILKAPVDLLWNGGIGTYVKSSREDHFAARDPANDRVRVNGSELRAKVAGEGGNLGLTQAGRIEGSARGVRLNTDAIDNSAGVNMSDHEVNIKIFLDQLLRKKKLPDIKTRNAVIRKYDRPMIELVLESNRQINLALSLDELRTPSQFGYMRALIKNLNRAGYLNREQDNIPFEADLDQLEQGERRLPRPVLCSLMGFTKLQLSNILLESNEFRAPWFDRFILRYFPEGLTRDYAADICRHPLKREIVVTEVLNNVVNHAGIAFFQHMGMRTDADEVRIALAYIRFSEFADLANLREGIGDPTHVPARIYYEYQLMLEKKVFSIVSRILGNPELLTRMEKTAPEKFSRSLEATREFSAFRLPRELRGALRQMDSKLQEHISGAFRRLDVFEDAFAIFDRLGRPGKHSDWSVADYFSVVENYQIDRLRQIARSLPHESTWEILFHARIEQAIEELLFSLLARASAATDRQDVRGLIDQLLALHTGGNLTTAAYFEMLEHLRREVANGAQNAAAAKAGAKGRT
ncbi:MAG: NAD-glutamate dehydrogenase [bacterium]|nr:NAD-glutamate dehydrogenase [bacterium]